ncbi:hypothetical protein HKO22_07170 [Peptoniphilus sp. AGMB00490]|uniref:NlpC/P60 domain-containing protein n=1 Tax=Peptoniphilus faecalis TaxID=2731255 RepID=A0A848RMK5_9FIRM|nr:NlpC/P60 family protein [Peptoniphilus faecalis]NMW85512.1 hypothetical protein [Peptoniphilus faecalis]
MLDKNKVEQFINAAMKYKGDNYSQPRRMQKGYSDCSSLIYKGLRDAKLLDLSKTDRTISTKYILDGDPRFTEIPKKELQRGDILWGGEYRGSKWDGHVAIYLGDGKTLEARYKEGVCIYVNRAYFKKVYRIKTLMQGIEKKEPIVKATPQPKPVYNYLTIMGKKSKISPQVIDGVSYVQLGSMMVPVRKFFEELGYDVKWTREKGIEIE